MAEVSGRIAGAFFIVDRRWRIGDRVWRATDGVDNVVDPDFRGQGLFSAMSDYFTAHLRNDFQCSIGNYTAHDAVKHRYPGHLDQMLANPVAAYVAVTDLRGFVGRIRRRSAKPARILGAAMLVVLRRALVPSRSAPSLRIDEAVDRRAVRDLEAIDDRFDRLWSEVEPTFHLAAVRDVAYLRWRYRDPRAARYLIRGVGAGDRLLGYSVSSIDGDWSNLVDLVVAPGRLDVALALVADVLDRARMDGAAACRCWSLRHHPHEPVLRSAGFLRGPEVRLLARGYGEDQPDLRFLRDPRPAVHVSYGDSDHV